MEGEVKTEAKTCEFKAYIGKDGQLVVEASSKECEKAAFEAVSEKGVDVKHVKPKAVTKSKPSTA